MSEAQFHVFLPSNASLDLYEENTLTSYTVHLPEPIALEGNYEVGLQSIIWPKTFFNITDSSNRFYYETAPGVSDTIVLTKGNYDSMEKLIKHINTKLKKDKKVKDNIQFKFNSISENVFVSVKNGFKVLLKGNLSQILGFGGKDKVIVEPQTSPFVADLSGGLRCLYIYCSIAGYQIVGDIKAKLLKVLPVEGAYGDTIFKTFDVPTYYPIGTKEFQDIKIDIRDDSGRKIQFNSGRVTVNLHIRQSQLPYIV